MKRRQFLYFIFIFYFAFLVFSDSIHTTYFWHLQQPIYWPAPSKYRIGYQLAYESMQRKDEQNGHPQNDLESIFGKDDRKAVYQYRIKDCIFSLLSYSEAGAQITYPGCLIENINSLAEHNWNGYSPSWVENFKSAMSEKTSLNNPRLDVVNFPFHHCLAPLVDEKVLEKEIGIYQLIYQDTFQKPLSKGYFPAELAFSERIIPVLLKFGIKWVIVPNTHISRVCKDFPLVLGSGGENCTPPNKADILNPEGINYFRKHIDRGCSPCNAYPFAYVPHKAMYVNPETGEIYKITIIPAAMGMSWDDGYKMYGTEDIDSIADKNNPLRPMLIVLAHDGDNAFGGGYSYYMESVPNFCDLAQSKGYVPSTIQDYLDKYPVPEDDVVHVEDGSWPNADGDFGSPRFINWNWPLVNSNGKVDIENGWAEDERNWAVITAALNRVLTAEQQLGNVNLREIYKPTEQANAAELAWHFLLPSVTSGYMYYGTSLDMEVKPTLACNKAVEYADSVIDVDNDFTPPTIWIPQRYPYNPGEVDFGPVEGYKEVKQPSDFYVWTFVYDVSGLSSVNLKIRIDKDGINPISSIQNETYEGGNEVGDWITIPMNKRSFPADNFFNDPNIDFFIMPTYIADEYWAKVSGYENVLIDYYVEAVDVKGNVKRSPIQHVWVGSGDGNNTSSYVSWQPSPPIAGKDITITYDKSNSPLANSSAIYIHYGFDNWDVSTITDKPMQENNGIFSYTINLPSDITEVDFVFHDENNNWDNNSNEDWKIPVIQAYQYVKWNPENPLQGETINITYEINNSPLNGAESLKIYYSFDNWNYTYSKNMSINNNTAVISILIPQNCQIFSFYFENEKGDIDNNNGKNWNISITSNFVMDGILDSGVSEILNENFHLWYKISGNVLYVATEPAVNEDVFIFVASEVKTNMISAPWSKSGYVAEINGGYLAAESNNDYFSWTGFSDGVSAAQNKSNVLEGIVDLSQSFDSIPRYVYVCVARYETHDGGGLLYQIPESADNNGNIEKSEFAVIPTFDTYMQLWELFK